MEWISIKDSLPRKGMLIAYCSKSKHTSAIGVYWDDKDDPRGPVPSRPSWLTWDLVTHWFELKDVPQ